MEVFLDDLTILIVDDEATTAEMFSLMLENEGYQTAVVHGTGTAIRAIQQHRPNLVLVDVMMPGLSGLEFCRFIRREPDLRDLPIIIASAMSQPEDVQAGMDAGADVYLMKPISKADLMEGVEAALQSSDGPAR
ncbi:MAG: response regulator [Anaerolineales bacterium]|jgi:CheY-like chemotaxis protein